MCAGNGDLTYQRYGEMLQNYYVRKFEECSAERQQRLARLQTKSDAENYIREVRGKLQESFGAFPERTPLNARVVKRVEHPQVTLECVVFESRPGLEVTANFYLPKNISGKIPAVLFVLGHTNSGKLGYQCIPQRLALNGFAVLVPDPIGQGERHQYDPEKDGVLGCSSEHSMIGRRLGLMGENFSMWRLWDGLRAMDYLLSRPEVDPEHVGVTGCSGGGTMTSYITAFEPRLTMAAPCCYLTTMLWNLKNELGADAEQNPPKFQALGLEEADFLIAAAPRPVMILAQDDDFFDPRGTRETYRDVRRIYELLGCPENVQLVFGPGSHGYPLHHQNNMRKFFCSLSGMEYREVEPVEFSEEEINCYPSGVRGGKTVQQLLDEMVEKLPEQPAGRSRKALAAAIRKVLKFEDPFVPDYRSLGTCVNQLNQEHLELETYFDRFRLITEPGIGVSLKHLTDGAHCISQPKFPENVTLFVPHLSSAPELTALGLDFTPERYLLSCEVRGIGESRASEVRHPTKKLFDVFGADQLHGASALMLDRPLLGGKVFDLLCTVEFLKSRGVKNIELIGNGMGAVVAALAACCLPELSSVTLHNVPESYRCIVRNRNNRWPLSMLPQDVLKHFDLPEVYGAVGAKVISTVVDPMVYEPGCK